MKQLFLLTAIAIFASCDRNCDEAKEQYLKEYQEAVKGAMTPEAINELTRQYNESVSNLDC